MVAEVAGIVTRWFKKVTMHLIGKNGRHRRYLMGRKSLELRQRRMGMDTYARLGLFYGTNVNCNDPDISDIT